MIKTKFGTANLRQDGYLHITSTKEGNFSKLLHRLIFEDFYNIQLPTDIDIHHNDGNKTNNEIWNLIPMTRSEHISLHKKGENNHNYGKPLKNSTKMKMSKTHNNSTGFFRVTRRPSKTCKNDFIYCYQTYTGGKKVAFESTDINVLKEKAIEKGFDWHIINEELANETIQESENYKASQLENHPTGIHRVRISTEKRAKQGFEYRFDYVDENGKRRRLSSVNLNKLKDKMISNGFDWIVLDEEKAKANGLI